MLIFFINICFHDSYVDLDRKLKTAGEINGLVKQLAMLFFFPISEHIRREKSKEIQAGWLLA